MKLLAIPVFLLSIIAALWIRQQLSVGGQFDFGSVVAIGIVFPPFGVLFTLMTGLVLTKKS
jgi:hypothetical protein